jgi:hypothetical protein
MFVGHVQIAVAQVVANGELVFAHFGEAGGPARSQATARTEHIGFSFERRLSGTVTSGSFI